MVPCHCRVLRGLILSHRPDPAVFCGDLQPRLFLHGLDPCSASRTVASARAPDRPLYHGGVGVTSFSGLTVGVLGSFIGIHWSLGLSSGALLVVTAALLAFMSRGDREAATAAASSPAR